MARDEDRLELDLHAPLLDDFMRSRELYQDLQAIGQQILGGYRTRVPRDTGDLSSTAKVSMHRSTTYRDRRWECEFSVGNSRVDYADDVERRDHPLAETLRALGWNVEEI